ncbi:MAG: hypothetical protein EBW71_06835 [Betaproteobacteria bacterium]|nr:hypothetical protein [Betaproteobacteria bacterium]NDB14580.1 hypothetical protein [Betaproteobacteria bacterium]
MLEDAQQIGVVIGKDPNVVAQLNLLGFLKSRVLKKGLVFCHHDLIGIQIPTFWPCFEIRAVLNQNRLQTEGVGQTFRNWL